MGKPSNVYPILTIKHSLGSKNYGIKDYFSFNSKREIMSKGLSKHSATFNYWEGLKFLSATCGGMSIASVITICTLVVFCLI